MQYTKKRQKPDSFRTIGTCLKQISVSFNLRRQQSKSISAQDLDAAVIIPLVHRFVNNCIIHAGYGFECAVKKT